MKNILISIAVVSVIIAGTAALCIFADHRSDDLITETVNGITETSEKTFAIEIEEEKTKIVPQYNLQDEFIFTEPTVSHVTIENR